MARWLLSAVLLTLPWSAACALPALDRLGSERAVRLSPNLIKAALVAAKHEPLQIAVGAALQADTSTGTWDETADGNARWRLRVISEAARSLSFEFSRLQLPPGAELWVYDPQGRDLQGPITATGSGGAWSPLVRGQEAVIEATMPPAQRAQFHLTLARAFHGYSDLSGRSFPYDPASGTGNGSAGACNVDVACSDGAGWQPQARSTVMLMIAGTTLCSGTLINNARQDDRPLVLTANHCGINALNVESTYAYFNVQRAGCASGGYGDLMQNLRGRTLLTSAGLGSGSDFSLFELASEPPAYFNAYYSGFDASGAVPTSGVGIHHPSGDDKKLSRYTSPAAAQSGICIGSSCALLGDGFRIDAWAVNWSKGTTEGGSSGSALWNSQGHLVGTLSGGTSQCASAVSNNGGTDYYARLDSAWTQPGGLLLGASLKSVLDPADGDCLTVAGKSPGDAAPLICTSPSTTMPPPTSGGTDSVAPSTTAGGGGGGGIGLWLAPLLVAGLLRRGRQRTAPKPVGLR